MLAQIDLVGKLFSHLKTSRLVFCVEINIIGEHKFIDQQEPIK